MARNQGLTLGEPAADDIDAIQALLAANDLPHAGLDERDVRFVAGYVDGDVVAAGGIEQYGSAALLRSVVVADVHRDQGYATAVCDELDAVAAARGVDSLVLLTTTAVPFFERRGFTVVPRDAVQERVRNTPEFTEHCPDTATCMRKRLRETE